MQSARSACLLPERVRGANHHEESNGGAQQQHVTAGSSAPRRTAQSSLHLQDHTQLKTLSPTGRQDGRCGAESAGKAFRERGGLWAGILSLNPGWGGLRCWTAKWAHMFLSRIRNMTECCGAEAVYNPAEFNNIGFNMEVTRHAQKTSYLIAARKAFLMNCELTFFLKINISLVKLCFYIH